MQLGGSALAVPAVGGTDVHTEAAGDPAGAGSLGTVQRQDDVGVARGIDPDALATARAVTARSIPAPPRRRGPEAFPPWPAPRTSTSANRCAEGPAGRSRRSTHRAPIGKYTHAAVFHH